MPSDVRWDSTKGCYISNDFVVDPSTGNFIERNSTTKLSSESKANILNDKEQWLLNHKDSNQEIDKALIKYNDEVINNALIRSNLKSYYDPNDDPALPILINLGIKNLPDILNRINSNDYWSGVLMATAEKITRTSNGHIYECILSNSPQMKTKLF